jgi:hypothetical protein
MWGEAQDNFSALQSWTPEARKRVEELQVREYRSLANDLGFAGDADKAYEHLMGNRALQNEPDVSSIWQTLGIEPPSDPDVRAAVEAPVAGLYERVASVEPPTRYEDPRNYFDMVLLLAAVLDHLTAKGTPAPSVPLVASLPSGDINAQIVKYPDIPTLLLFERGLFRFCVDMANVLAWTVVPLTVEQIGDDNALIGLPRTYAISPQASQFFLGSLHAYVVGGSPMANENSVPKAVSNRLLAVTMGTQMKRFVMAHELAHFGLGHLDTPASKGQEHEADSASAYIVAQMARDSFGSWAAGFWACDFTLTAFHFLEKSIGLLEYGTDSLKWISDTHPNPVSRRALLRARAPNTDDVTPTNIAAAEAVCGMTDDLFAKLWELQSPWLYKAHLEGARPAAIWRSHAKTNLAPSK